MIINKVIRSSRYDKNDLQAVTEILDYLEKGKHLQNRNETISKKAQLETEIAQLRQSLQVLIQFTVVLKNSET